MAVTHFVCWDFFQWLFFFLQITSLHYINTFNAWTGHSSNLLVNTDKSFTDWLIQQITHEWWWISHWLIVLMSVIDLKSYLFWYITNLIYSCDQSWNFQHQFSVSRDPSQIILICWFDAQETVIIIISVEKSTAYYIYGNHGALCFSGFSDE